MATCCSLQLPSTSDKFLLLPAPPAVVLLGVHNVFIALFSHFPPFPPFPLFLMLMVHVTYNILRQQRHSFLILSLANLAEATPFMSIASRLCKTQRTKIDAEFSLYSINNTRHNSSHIVACEDFPNTNIWEHQSSTFKMLAHNKL